MSMFKKEGKKEAPAISTASLPDIVFILLFFFMVVTKTREHSLKVKVNTPRASEVSKIEKKNLVGYFFVGVPNEVYQDRYGTAPRLQLNDQIATKEDIPQFVQKEKAPISGSDRDAWTASLRVDGEVTMGILTDIKTSLRKAQALKVMYSAKPRAAGAKIEN